MDDKYIVTSFIFISYFNII